MGTTTTITLPESPPRAQLTLLNVLIQGYEIAYDLTTDFYFQAGTYPVTWTSKATNLASGRTTPIRATSREYPGLALDVVIVLDATLETTGKVTYDTSSTTLELTITSYNGTRASDGMNVRWDSGIYTGYNSDFTVGLDDGTRLTLRPSFSWPILDLSTDAFTIGTDFRIQLRSGPPYPNPIKLTKRQQNYPYDIFWSKTSRSDYVMEAQYTGLDCPSQFSTYGTMEVAMHIVFYDVAGKTVGVPFRVDSIKITSSERICRECNRSDCNFLKMPITTFRGSSVSYVNLWIPFGTGIYPRAVKLITGVEV